MIYHRTQNGDTLICKVKQNQSAEEFQEFVLWLYQSKAIKHLSFSIAVIHADYYMCLHCNRNYPGRFFLFERS